jgi:protein-S-isoprenylcysteine O-methyltransferase Ste14
MTEPHNESQLIESHYEHNIRLGVPQRLGGRAEESGESKANTVASPTQVPAPALAAKLGRMNAYGMTDLGGGPRPWKLAWVIDFQKIGTFPLLGLLIAWYHNMSVGAWVYLAMHGSYGLVWMVKDLAFPDPSWQRRITIASGLYVFFGVLVWYWAFGWLLISGTSQPAYPLPDSAWFCLCISLCIEGNVIMIAADAQKYFTLRARRGLITDGMYRYIRHPNYLGEMMVYGSFALLVWHWLPAAVLACVWGGLFAVNMTLKEASMSRYPEWSEYKQRSWWLLPLVL